MHREVGRVVEGGVAIQPGEQAGSADRPGPRRRGRQDGGHRIAPTTTPRRASALSRTATHVSTATRHIAHSVRTQARPASVPAVRPCSMASAHAPYASVWTRRHQAAPRAEAARRPRARPNAAIVRSRYAAIEPSATAFGRYADANGTSAPRTPTPDFASARIVPICKAIKPKPNEAAARWVYCRTTRADAERIFTEVSAPSDVASVRTTSAARPAPRAVYQSVITRPPFQRARARASQAWCRRSRRHRPAGRPAAGSSAIRR